MGGEGGANGDGGWGVGGGGGRGKTAGRELPKGFGWWGSVQYIYRKHNINVSLHNHVPIIDFFFVKVYISFCFDKKRFAKDREND